jgi:hypothetical protein
MRLAMDSACVVTQFFRVASFAFSAAACLLISGCAGWSSMGDHQASLMGWFWNRRSESAETPGYDLYAKSMAAARPQGAKSASPASAGPTPGQQPQDKAKTTTSSSDRGERASSTPGLVRGRNPDKSTDTSIRVTLGRPESLPTLADTGGQGGPALAMADTTNWQRAGSVTRLTPLARPVSRSTLKTARRVDANEEPEPLVEPPIRRERSASPQDKLRLVLTEARSRLESMRTYQVKITRVERVGGQLQNEEEALLSIRRKPKGVRLEWTDGPSKGREVIYSSTVNDRMMYVNMANSALPISRMSIPVDSPLALRNSRHPITEAGFDTIFDNVSTHTGSRLGSGEVTGKLEYKGIVKPDGLNQACHLIERVSPAGETWKVYLDTLTLMPAEVVAHRTGNGELVERYTYKNLKPNPLELAAAEAFDPDKRWGESKSWLSRLARAAGPQADANPRQTTTR